MRASTHGETLRPTAFVIFGATGDLALSKLFPALLDLFVTGMLPARFALIGLARGAYTDSTFQAFVEDQLRTKHTEHTEEVVHAFCTHLRYVSGSFEDSTSYDKIKDALNTYDVSIGQCTNKLFYLAVSTQYYDVIFDRLHTSKALALCDEVGSWARLLVEKPFGRDLATAEALERKLSSLFLEEQIFRIDHYLAKDAIESIIALRFANSILADSWDGQAIESIAIRSLEMKDVSNRGAFYDVIGTLRDVGQNHLLQIFALLTMPPVDIRDSAAVREARAQALGYIADCFPETIVRGQYAGYANVDGVGNGTQTETYFKLTGTLTHEPWRGVSYTFEAGKALNEQLSEAVVVFRPKNLCHCGDDRAGHEHRNVLRIRFSPKAHISLSIWTKAPGFDFALREQCLTLVASEGDDISSPEAYERVLFDCIAGDQTRFVSSDEGALAWKFITPILSRFADIPLEMYEPGSAGPASVYQGNKQTCSKKEK